MDRIHCMRAFIAVAEAQSFSRAARHLSLSAAMVSRRVNALEHILIPNIKETIKYIADRLEEMERSYQVQLMRIKDIVGER